MKIPACSLTLLALLSCAGEPTATTTPPASERDSLTTAPAPAPEEKMFAWVDDLNVREAPRTGSPSLTKIRQEAPVFYLGERTDFTEKITLRGKAFDEPWLKIRTEDGTVGWAFGGALRKVGEVKGPPPALRGVIDIPHFGRYDLGVWRKENETEEAAGDSEITTKLYSLGTQLLQLERGSSGEYGYHRTYRLIDDRGQLLRVRHLAWETLRNNLLHEEVIDFTTATRYFREEERPQHFSQLKEAPESLDLTFSEQRMTEAELAAARERYGE